MSSVTLNTMVAGIPKTFALQFGKFTLGDIVSSFPEQDRPHMSGTGEVLAIKPNEERPFVCEFDGRLYFYKESEISHAEMY